MFTCGQMGMTVGPMFSFGPVPRNLSASAMRKTMGLSQRVFAKLVGVSVKTVRNWEQGRRQPSGPAVVLLTMLVADPDAVLRAVR
jgi:putative transcriptional regulator